MLLFLSALLLGAATFVLAEMRTLPARQRSELMKRAASYGARAVQGPAVRDPAAYRSRLFSRLVTWVGTALLRLMPRTTRGTVTQRLLQAGLANRVGADEFVAAKGLLAAIGVAFGLLIGSAAGGAIAAIFALCFGIFGFLGPDLFVNGRIRDRRDRIQAALPDTLDLLAVTVEAGLGFDGAVAKLIENMEGPLVDEFALAHNEVRIGKSRMDALKDMGARIDVPEVTSFVRAIVQADHLGMSIGAMLRIQATDARVRRQLAAEEKAMKAPIKMIFPLVFFILPATFIVILGPFFMTFGERF